MGYDDVPCRFTVMFSFHVSFCSGEYAGWLKLGFHIRPQCKSQACTRLGSIYHLNLIKGDHMTIPYSRNSCNATIAILQRNTKEVSRVPHPENH